MTWFFTVTDPDNNSPLVLPTPEYLTPYYLYQVNQDGMIKKDTVRQVEPCRVTPEAPAWALQKIGSRINLILMKTTTRERVAVEAIRTSQQRQRLLQQRQMPLLQWQNPLQGQQEEVETGTLKRMLDGWEPQDNVTSLTLKEEVTNTVSTGLVRSGNRIFAVIDRTLHIVDITDSYNLRLLGKVELPIQSVDLVQIR